MDRLIDLEFGARQQAFRRRVQESGLVVQSFTDPATLGQPVERSLREVAERHHPADSGSPGGLAAVVVAGRSPRSRSDSSHARICQLCWTDRVRGRE